MISISYGLLTLASCKDDDIPVPFHSPVDQDAKDFFYFTTGSWWVYESNDGFYDTVTVVSYWIDTFNYVDKNDNLINTTEYFSFTYYSSYLDMNYSFNRGRVAPMKNSNTYVRILTDNGSSWMILNTPNEKGIKYSGSNNYDFFTITNKSDTLIRSVNRKLWSIDYNYWSMYDDLPVKVDMVSGVGITKKQTTFENRTWNLIDYWVFNN